MKISSSQIFWILASFEIGMTLLLTIPPSLTYAKQDAWISFLAAAAAASAITYASLKLSLLYPDQTFVEFIPAIVGKWPGKLVVALYLLVWYSVIGNILREASDFFSILLLRRTPVIVVILLIIVTIVYVTYNGGIEAIGRTSEIVGPIIYITVGMVFLLSYMNIDTKRVLPVFADSGITGILQGAIPPFGFLGESVVLMMLVPFVKDRGKLISRAIGAVLFASVFLTLAVLICILVFGPDFSSKLWYPFFEVARYISLMEFIQNMELFVVIIWFLSVFIKLSTYLFAVSYGTAQLLGIPSWRLLIWPITLLVGGIAYWFPNIAVSSVDYPNTVWVRYVVPVHLVALPLLLWAVGSIRKSGRFKRKGSPV